MKTLSNPADKQEILLRLRSARANMPRRWGKMSAHQMICHLSDGFRMYMAVTPVKPAPQPIPQALLKLAALWAPIPWPHGFQTVPELDQHADGTPPAVFDADVRELQALLDRFTRQPRDYHYQPHPHFGALSEKEWMRLAYLHSDHHLRQFGA
jgi:Protein of unknown function (DUF1569)